MPRIAIIFGVLLTALGTGGYFAEGKTIGWWSVLLPGILGLLLAILDSWP